MIKCECSERIGSVINSYQLYEEIKKDLDIHNNFHKTSKIHNKKSKITKKLFEK